MTPVNEYEAAVLLEAFARDARIGPDAIALDSDPLDWPLEERPVIYVAGYYSACPTQGTANAIKAFDALLAVGWIPLVPHASLVIDMLSPHPPEFWYRYDMALLARCDAMYVCPDALTAQSTGVRDEMAFAVRHDIPIFDEVVEAKDRYNG